MNNLRKFDLNNKKVLVRCDFNVPLDRKGNILDNFRIKKSLPTIKYLLEKKAKIILISHLGRPNKSKNTKFNFQKYSLRPVALEIEKLLKQKINFLEDCIGIEVEKEVKKMKSKDIIFLENLRFYREEEGNNKNFSKKLAKLGDIYVNNAFACCHREHSSIIGIPKFLLSAPGFLVEKEINVFSSIISESKRPLVVIIGGIKISTKIEVIKTLLKDTDNLIIGGEIANSILQIKGICVRDFAQDIKPGVKKEIKKINIGNPKLHLPLDAVISLKDIKLGVKNDYLREGAIGTLKENEKIYDIGNESIKIFSKIIKEARTIIWNGPLGLYEEKLFQKGTKEIAKAIVKNSSSFKVVGGGETNFALAQLGLRKNFDYVSTGGGAMLELLIGKKLPGIEALK